MSRTDKDTPLYARAEWWEPDHRHCPYDQAVAAVPRYTGPWPYEQPTYVDMRWYACDLPAEPRRRRPDRTRPWRLDRLSTADDHCRWVPIPPGPRRRCHAPSAPRWYIRHVYHARQRTLVRAQLQQAAAEYRAAGDTDVVPTIEQARNGARWTWW